MARHVVVILEQDGFPGFSVVYAEAAAVETVAGMSAHEYVLAIGMSQRRAGPRYVAAPLGDALRVAQVDEIGGVVFVLAEDEAGEAEEAVGKLVEFGADGEGVEAGFELERAIDAHRAGPGGADLVAGLGVVWLADWLTVEKEMAGAIVCTQVGEDVEVVVTVVGRLEGEIGDNAGLAGLDEGNVLGALEPDMAVLLLHFGGPDQAFGGRVAELHAAAVVSPGPRHGRIVLVEGAIVIGDAEDLASLGGDGAEIAAADLGNRAEVGQLLLVGIEAEQVHGVASGGIGCVIRPEGKTGNLEAAGLVVEVDALDAIALRVVDVHPLADHVVVAEAAAIGELEVAALGTENGHVRLLPGHVGSLNGLGLAGVDAVAARAVFELGEGIDCPVLAAIDLRGAGGSLVLRDELELLVGSGVVGDDVALGGADAAIDPAGVINGDAGEVLLCRVHATVVGELVSFRIEGPEHGLWCAAGPDGAIGGLNHRHVDALVGRRLTVEDEFAGVGVEDEEGAAIGGVKLAVAVHERGVGVTVGDAFGEVYLLGFFRVYVGEENPAARADVHAVGDDEVVSGGVPGDDGAAVLGDIRTDAAVSEAGSLYRGLCQRGRGDETQLDYQRCQN